LPGIVLTQCSGESNRKGSKKTLQECSANVDGDVIKNKQGMLS
jgi:hypothetical protein